jgi:hypothetical protein
MFSLALAETRAYLESLEPRYQSFTCVIDAAAQLFPQGRAQSAIGPREGQTRASR